MLMRSVHLALSQPGEGLKFYLATGEYEYYHYLVDGFNDVGWGCGYRTLQTMCSWMCLNGHAKLERHVPSIPEIQKRLVLMGDKDEAFIGSKSWIGTFEACIILDQLYQVPCKMQHVVSGSRLSGLVDDLINHFYCFGSPVMMGGDVDCSSKGIMGVAVGCRSEESMLLVVDPHFQSAPGNKQNLVADDYVAWRPIASFLDDSFYNVCLPQVAALF